MVVHDRLYTVNEYESFIAKPNHQERLFELVHGEIVEKLPTEEHGVIAANIVTEIKIYLKQHPIGRVAVEARYRIPTDEHNSRLPDVSFTSSERTLPLVKKGAVPQMPDLAIEIKSPDQSFKEMREKADYYLANGSRMVWVVYPEKHLVEVHEADDFEILTEQDVISGGEVLPDFTLAVNEIFEF